ncbi:MAG: hypothetical protein ACLRTA_00430 [Clostridia bacterium]
MLTEAEENILANMSEITGALPTIFSPCSTTPTSNSKHNR